jgi:hypothetical protein
MIVLGHARVLSERHVRRSSMIVLGHARVLSERHVRRSSMIVLGHARVLRKAGAWRRLVRDSKSRRALFPFPRPFDQTIARLTADAYNKVGF